MATSPAPGGEQPVVAVRKDVESTKRIARIEVDELFGIFKHSVPLNLDERITILHGPNGVGKTVLLRLLDGLFNGNMRPIRAIPFSRFAVTLDDKSKITVSKRTKRRRAGDEGPVEIAFEYSRGRDVVDTYVVPTADADASWLPFIEMAIPELSRVTPRLWRNSNTGEHLRAEEVIDRYPAQVASLIPDYGKPPPPWLDELRASVQIRLVDTERLRPLHRLTARERERARVRGEPEPPSSAVVAYSRELAASLQDTLARSATLSQSLDRTFPARVVTGPGKPELSESDLREELEQLEIRRAELRDAGLLDKETDTPFQIPSEIGGHARAILSVYVEDVKQKLGVFDDMAAKTDLLTRILNDRFKYKRVVINRDAGFTFLTDRDEPLPSTALSSGEQHELVLLYELLFKVQRDDCVLIDEPELSLHVEWQTAFLRDLEEVARLGEFDVVMATHSPQIIGDRWDLTVELKGPPNGDSSNRGGNSR